MAECLIGGIHIDTSTAEGQNIYVGLPNGVTLQQSLMEDAESIYGAPKDRYETDTSVQFTYEYGLYQTITLGFDNETGILYSLDMQNFTTTADAEALDGVSDATTPEVEAYQAPEADSSEINDWTVRFDDVLYHLPVPVSELLDHDWTVNTKESDTAVFKRENTANVTLEKGGQKLTAPYIISARRRRSAQLFCYFAVRRSRYDKDSDFNHKRHHARHFRERFSGEGRGCQIRKTEKEDSNLTLYTFYSDDEKLDYTEIGIDNDLKLVRSIKVVHNQPEAPEEEAKKNFRGRFIFRFRQSGTVRNTGFVTILSEKWLHGSLLQTKTRIFMENLYDVIIIGSGPAGLSAAIYAKRAKLSSLTIEANFASGGQVLNTYEVDNYPGLPGISGMDLGSTLRAHAEKMGAEFSRERVKELVLDEEIKIVRTRKMSIMPKRSFLQPVRSTAR